MFMSQNDQPWQAPAATNSDAGAPMTARSQLMPNEVGPYPQFSPVEVRTYPGGPRVQAE